MADIFIHNRSHKLYNLLHVAEHSETHEKLAIYCSADGKGTLKPRFEKYEEQV